MSNTALHTNRTAQTDSPVLDVLADRWSPRSFDPSAPLDEDKLASALEAARWSPSASNSQPWRFIVALRGTAEHATLVASLMGFNQMWAGDAGAIVVGIAETATADGDPIGYANYDLGQAVAHLSIQAHHDGLYVHQMAGFDREAISAAFGLEARLVPTVAIAIGEIGDPTALPDALHEREVAPRVRRPLAESLIVAA